MPKQLQSAIIYRSPSLIDGTPIVAIATYSKRNRKTGGMLQTYILADGVDPRVANKTGGDYSICGSCPFRGTPNTEPKRKLAKDRKCYVRIEQGPLHVYRTLQRGVYPIIRGHKALSELGKGRMVRIGTYGDGAAVPSYIWDSLDPLSSIERGGTACAMRGLPALRRQPRAGQIHRNPGALIPA
jgi:hypothetical protein